jgi:hypothetical protein
VPRKQVIIGAVAVAGLVLAVAADRIAASVVEHRLASRLQCAAGLDTTPDVQLSGFPALTQLTSQSLDEIHVQARDVQLPKLTVSLEADARQVSLAEGSVGVGAVTVTATIAYSELSGLPGFGAGKKNATGSPDGGQGDANSGSEGSAGNGTAGDGNRRGLTAADATVYADVALADERLTVTPAEVELSSFGLRLPASRLPAAASQARIVDLPALPGSLAYRSVTPTADGLRVVAGGTDLRLEPKDHIKSDKTCGGTA